MGETFNSNITGIHNIFNLSAAIIYTVREGKYPLSSIKKVVKNLTMVKRRQEVRGTWNGALLIDDFAHHPTAIAGTIDTIATNHPQKSIVVVLEPRSATARSSLFSGRILPASLGPSKKSF